jgi:hypothetical protein
LRRCHGADEWVSIEATRACVELYGTLAASFCGDEVSTTDAGEP